LLGKWQSQASPQGVPVDAGVKLSRPELGCVYNAGRALEMEGVAVQVDLCLGYLPEAHGAGPQWSSVVMNRNGVATDPVIPKI